MKNIIAVMAATIFLTGCSFEPDVEVGREIRTFEVTQVNQPKHFRANLKDVKTGQVYKSVSISKHCNDWRKLKVGSKWDLMTVEYERKGKNAGQRYIYISGAKNLCNALKNI